VTKTTVYLDTDIALALRHMAETQGRSQAELIRDALQTYTRGAKRPLPRGLGKYDSGETHGAERAKDFLRSATRKGRWRQ
jgi:predicted transcriptional regulator